MPYFKARYNNVGESMDYTPGSAVSAGVPQVIASKLIGIPTSDIAASAKGALALRGVFYGAVDAESGFTQGKDVYWDADGTPEDSNYGAASSGCFTDDPATGPWCGKALADANDGVVLFALNGPHAETQRANIEVVAATRTLTAAESGKVIFLNHATEFATTLPAVAAGLEFTFIVGAAPSGASYTVVSASSANVIVGHGSSGDMDAAGDVDSETSGGDTITFVDSKAVKGDRCHVICDGTNWYAMWSSKAFDAITITTAS